MMWHSDARPESLARTGRRWLVLLALVAMTAYARADVFHLESGGVIEGKLLGSDGDHYIIRTAVGTVRVPVSTVERIEEAPSPYDEYDERAKGVADTPEAQTALAKWCEEQGLRGERRRHLFRAIKLNPDYEPARRALGHTRVGELWVDGRKLSGRQEEGGAAGQDEEADRERAERAIRGGWNRHIRAMKRSLLDSSMDRLVQDGEARIVEIKDPQAIVPLSRVLSRGNVRCRALLVKALSAFAQDDATFTLAVIALTDPAETIRQSAVAELVRRQEPGVVAQFRQALLDGNDVIVGRAAHGLGELGVKEAIPDLIQSLTVQRRKWVEVPVDRLCPDRGWLRFFGAGQGTLPFRPSPHSIAGYSGVWLDASACQTARRRCAWQGGGWPAGFYSPQVGAWYRPDIGMDVRNQWRYRSVTVYRTEVLEALKRITGQNFGFERDEWWRWYEELKQ